MFNRLGLMCVVLALFMPGCGKKEQVSKKVADAGIPTIQQDTESFLDEGAVSDFAFVDEDALVEDSKADTSALIAEADAAEVDEKYAFKTVHFDFNKNEIREDQRSIVEEDAAVAKSAVESGKKVVVHGHCDQMGSASYNLALSQRRAEAVKTEMLNAGVPAENVKTVGYGYEMPLVWSDKHDRADLIKDLAPNRRAEVIVN